MAEDAPNPTAEQLPRMIPKGTRSAVTIRIELTNQADEAALRGNRFAAEREFGKAMIEYRKALEILPDAPVVWDRYSEWEWLLYDTTLKAAIRDLQGGLFFSAFGKLSKGGAYRMAMSYRKLKNDSAGPFRTMAEVNWPRWLFLGVMVAGMIASGLIQIRNGRRRWIVGYGFPLLFAAGVLALLLSCIISGYYEIGTNSNLGWFEECVKGAGLCGLSAMIVVVLPYLLGGILGRQIQLHFLRNRGQDLETVPHAAKPSRRLGADRMNSRG